MSYRGKGHSSSTGKSGAAKAKASANQHHESKDVTDFSKKRMKHYVESRSLRD